MFREGKQGDNENYLDRLTTSIELARKKATDNPSDEGIVTLLIGLNLERERFEKDSKEDPPTEFYKITEHLLKMLRERGYAENDIRELLEDSSKYFSKNPTDEEIRNAIGSVSDLIFWRRLPNKKVAEEEHRVRKAGRISRSILGNLDPLQRKKNLVKGEWDPIGHGDAKRANRIMDAVMVKHRISEADSLAELESISEECAKEPMAVESQIKLIKEIKDRVLQLALRDIAETLTQGELATVQNRYRDIIADEDLSKFDDALRTRRESLPQEGAESLNDEEMGDLFEAVGNAEEVARAITEKTQPLIEADITLDQLSPEDRDMLEGLIREAEEEEARNGLIKLSAGQKALVTKSVAEAVMQNKTAETEALDALDEAWRAGEEILEEGPKLQVAKGKLNLKNEKERMRELIGSVQEGVLCSGIDAKIKKKGGVELDFAKRLKDLLDPEDDHIVDELSIAASELVYTDDDAPEIKQVFAKYQTALNSAGEALEKLYGDPYKLLEVINEQVLLAHETRNAGEVRTAIAAIRDKTYWEKLRETRPWLGLGTLTRSLLGSAVRLADRMNLRKVTTFGALGLALASPLGDGRTERKVTDNIKPKTTVENIVQVSKASPVAIKDPMPTKIETGTRVVEIWKKGSAWRAANKLGRELGMSEQTFRKTWFNPKSLTYLVDGRVHVSDGDWTNEGDLVCYIEDTPGSGHFEIDARKSYRVRP
ncbi:MAG TPA: hypothetical protein VJJ22_00455 [Candidatus Paceibacterota bacterium]